jgi:hypothetical protein
MDMKEQRIVVMLSYLCTSAVSCIYRLQQTRVNVNDKEELWDYKPMVSIGNNLFGDTGYTKDKLPDEWVMIGEIEKEVPQHEPMVKGETYYVANALPVGTAIYGYKKDANIIYAKFNSTFIKFELMEGRSFIANILENSGTSLLVEPEKGSAELSSADKIIVDVRDAALVDAANTEITISEIVTGKQVEISYHGGIAESYPAQIQGCYRVRLLDCIGEIGGGGLQGENLTAIPGINEVAEAYQKATEAFYWFEVTTMPVASFDRSDSSTYKEIDGMLYHRVTSATIKTYADLENYLYTLFTQEIVAELLDHGGDYQRYRDIDGALHAILADRGTDIFKGEETLAVTQESDVKFTCTVSVELLSEAGDFAVTGYEVHEYSYELIDGQWVFTNFYLFR